MQAILLAIYGMQINSLKHALYNYHKAELIRQQTQTQLFHFDHKECNAYTL